MNNTEIGLKFERRIVFDVLWRFRRASEVRSKNAVARPVVVSCN